MGERRSRSRSPRPSGGGEAARQVSKGYQGRPKDGPNNVLFVAGLEAGVTNDDIKDMFEDVGIKTDQVDMPMDGYKRAHKGYAFVDLSNANDVDAAVVKLNGHKLRGREIKVEEKQSRVWKSDTRRESSRGRGGKGRGRGYDSRRRGGYDSRRRRSYGRGGGGRRNNSRRRSRSR